MSANRWPALAAVGAGGAAGTLLRAGVGQIWPTTSGHLPLATLGVNVVGALCLGLLTGALATADGRLRLLRIAAGTGLMGGLTTHSTFVVETYSLMDGGRPGLGTAYFLGSLAAGVLAAAAGLAVGPALSARMTGGGQEQ